MKFPNLKIPSNRRQTVETRIRYGNDELALSTTLSNQPDVANWEVKMNSTGAHLIKTTWNKINETSC